MAAIEPGKLSCSAAYRDRLKLCCGRAGCITEWTLTGTHEGEYIAIPPTHRSVELPACSIFTLGADGLIGEEVVYFDAATLLRQLGVLPESADGQPPQR